MQTFLQSVAFEQVRDRAYKHCVEIKKKALELSKQSGAGLQTENWF
jgi:hypothetical protein